MSNLLQPVFLARFFFFFLPVDAPFRKTLESILLYIIQYIGGTSSLSQCQSANTVSPLSNDLFRTNTSAVYLSKNYLRRILWFALFWKVYNNSCSGDNGWLMASSGKSCRYEKRPSQKKTFLYSKLNTSVNWKEHGERIRPNLQL